MRRAVATAFTRFMVPADRMKPEAVGPVVLSMAVVLLVLLPIVTILWLAAGASVEGWRHFSRTVLPRALTETFILLIGVAALVLVIGAGTAWIVTMFRFPGRRVIDRLLVLPLAMPSYITAYAYVEVFDYGGTVNVVLRGVFGRSLDVRSMTGAIFVLGLVLYPYVYLSARASFVQQSVCVLEVARTLGQTAFGAFLRVALPLARPALAAGAALALMECLNDFGAVQYLGVETLTVAVYSTWLQRGSIGGAAQIAVLGLVIALALFFGERVQRGAGRVHHTTGRYRAIPFSELAGWHGYLAGGLCLLPVLFGFLLPFVLLLVHAVNYLEDALTVEFWRAAYNSVMLAGVSAVVATAIGLGLVYAGRTYHSLMLRPLLRFSSVGYAIPGIILALGLVMPMAALDGLLHGIIKALFGVSSGLIISGSVVIVVLAYVSRFLAAAVGGIEAGYERLSPNLDAAARTLGESASSALLRVHLPMLAPALAAALLLVFVDGMKELPATLLLRPMNFETLATKVYTYAALEQFEHGALGALCIVFVGLLPVLMLHRAVAGGRAGG